MDETADIKARLPIEELVGQYCQLQKKGRNFVALCPFHKDSRPSLLVSPDKGIAYCFACQTGGDIFSFYQSIEGVDFRQALRDLGERTGVKIEEKKAGDQVIKKGEKERVRECLETAASFFMHQLKDTKQALQYLTDRNVTSAQQEQFQLGFAPDSFSQTYEHLLKQGFSRKEILMAGLGIQKDLREERIYDRFRNRLMFPIHDHQGGIIAFGGRTLGDDDAKYINSSESVLFHKSSVLFGLHHAKESMRTRRAVLLVEGYFDLLACHGVGVTHVVATCGTALTEQHVSTLKRYVDTVILGLDSDRAGKEASERAYFLLSTAGLNVQSIELPTKDASELLQKDPTLLKTLLEDGGAAYLDRVIQEVRTSPPRDPAGKRDVLQRILELLSALPFAVERKEYLGKAAAALQTTLTALEEDIEVAMARKQSVVKPLSVPKTEQKSPLTFSSVEITLGLFLLYPRLKALLSELIEPEEGFAAAIYKALMGLTVEGPLELDALGLPAEHRERASILMLFGEEHGFLEWSESLAAREIRKNCIAANRDMLRHKLDVLKQKILEARSSGSATDEALLLNQYQKVLKLLSATK
jgi:DNA primase